MTKDINKNRRRTLQSVGLGLLSAGGVSFGRGVDTAQAQDNSESWTQYGFDTRNTGYAPNYAAPAENIQTKWTFGDPMDSGVFTTPAVVDEVVYVNYSDFVDSETGALFALDANTGEEIWQFDVDDLPGRSPPVVAGETVYFGTGDGSLETDPSRLYAINKDTGESRWNYQIEGSIRTSPKVNDGTVYFASRTNDAGIYAISASDGTLEWYHETGNNSATPAVTDDAIYYVRNGVHAISKEDGSEIWSQTELNAQGSAPTVSNGRVFIGSRTEIGEDPEDDDVAGLYALDIDSGDIIWHFETHSDVQSSPAVAEDMVIVGIRNPDEHVYAVNMESGEEEWEYEVGDIRFQSPVVVDSVVFVGDDQTFYGLDLQTGNQLWEYTEDGTNHSLAVANNTVYFGTNSGTVHALEGDARSNTPTTVFQQAQNVADSPLAVTGVGAAVAGLGYTAYRRIQSDNTEDSSNNRTQQTPKHTSNSSVEGRSADLNSVKSYSEITISDQIKSGYSVCIQNGIVDNHSIWVSTPANTGETISTVEATEFVEQTEPWTRMDAHPNLLNVYGSGSDPLPWAAVEQGDYRQLSDQVDTLSTDDLLSAIEQICEAVHHVNRYGTTYKNLTTETILYTDDNEVKLRGVLDQFKELDPWYNAPEEFDAKSTEQSTIYRIGLIAYELFTGTLPYAEYPDGVAREAVQLDELIPPSEQVDDIPAELESIITKALSKSPDDRYETVLHLRDEFDSLDIS